MISLSNKFYGLENPVFYKWSKFLLEGWRSWGWGMGGGGGGVISVGCDQACTPKDQDSTLIDSQLALFC